MTACNAHHRLASTTPDPSLLRPPLDPADVSPPLSPPLLSPFQSPTTTFRHSLKLVAVATARINAQSLWSPVADYPEDDCPSENHYTGNTITPLFGEVEVEADGVSRAYADKCVAFLHNIPDALLDTMLRATMYYREKVTAERKTYRNPTDILKEVSAYHAAIDEELDVAGVSLSMNCEWEDEHGMAWAFTENEVIYVGPFDSMILARGVSEYSWHLRMPQ